MVHPKEPFGLTPGFSAPPNVFYLNVQIVSRTTLGLVVELTSSGKVSKKSYIYRAKAAVV